MPVTRLREPRVREVRSVPADLDALRPFRAALVTALEERGWEREEIARVLVCALEAMANAVRHGSADGARVSLAFTVTSSRAVLRVVDGGRPGRAVPTILRRDPPPPSQPGGRGLVLIHGLADRAAIGRRGGGTRVRLAFRRMAPPHQSPPWAA